jgi:hypothetical protein
MNENERPTPLTSAIIDRCHKQRVKAGKSALDEGSLLTLIGALANHSEALERMCAKLAEALELNKPSLCEDLGCGYERCIKAREALARYTAMKEGKL